MNTSMFKRRILLGTASLMVAGLVACASDVKKVDFAADSTQSGEMQKTQAMYDEAIKSDVEVLDNKNFVKATDYLDRAKEQQRNGAKSEKVMYSLGYAQAHLNKATETSAGRRAKLEDVLKARRAALDAGARTQPKTQKAFLEQDRKFEDDIGALLKEEKNANLFNKFQTAYLDLELEAMKATHLSQSRDQIENAKKLASGATVSRTRAEKSLANAENVITANRHSDADVLPAVATAKRDSQFALDVAATMKDRKTTEAVAIDLVNANAANQALKGNLEQTQARSAAAQRALQGELSTAESQRQALERQRTSLENEKASLASEVQLQEALENSRKQFSPKDAESFIQDGKLVIRMKNVNFPSGRADIPSAAIPALAKVKDVIKELNSKDVTVEGHTDSVGQNAVNQSLSDKRAETVASYLKEDMKDISVASVGYGAEKPIANNKTKTGRAENRRVDVIITPGSERVTE